MIPPLSAVSGNSALLPVMSDHSGMVISKGFSAMGSEDQAMIYHQHLSWFEHLSPLGDNEHITLPWRYRALVSTETTRDESEANQYEEPRLSADEQWACQEAAKTSMVELALKTRRYDQGRDF